MAEKIILKCPAGCGWTKKARHHFHFDLVRHVAMKNDALHRAWRVRKSLREEAYRIGELKGYEGRMIDVKLALARCFSKEQR